MSEWVCFGLTAAGLIAALAFLTAGVIGNFRFGSALNRLHAAGVGDTLGMLLLTGALMISAATVPEALRLALPAVFLCITSPISSHFLAVAETEKAPEKGKKQRRRRGGKR